MAYAEGVNSDFESELSLLLCLALRLINGRWIKFNNETLYLSELATYCYLCMGVYKSQKNSPSDDLQIDISNMNIWKSALRQYHLSKAQQTQSSQPTSTSTPHQSKLLLANHLNNLNC